MHIRRRRDGRSMRRIRGCRNAFTRFIRTSIRICRRSMEMYGCPELLDIATFFRVIDMLSQIDPKEAQDSIGANGGAPQRHPRARATRTGAGSTQRGLCPGRDSALAAMTRIARATIAIPAPASGACVVERVSAQRNRRAQAGTRPMRARWRRHARHHSG